MVGTTRTDNGNLSPVIVSKQIVATSNLFTSVVGEPNEAKQMSSVWWGCTLKLFAKPSVRNDLWEPSSRRMLASIPVPFAYTCATAVFSKQILSPAM